MPGLSDTILITQGTCDDGTILQETPDRFASAYSEAERPARVATSAFSVEALR
jgi:hypothetical protein